MSRICVGDRSVEATVRRAWSTRRALWCAIIFFWVFGLGEQTPLGGQVVDSTAVSTQSQSRPVRPPNVVIILVDDLGVMDTSVPFLTDTGGKPERHPLNDFYRTPHLQALAQQGLRFSQFYAMSVCSPTRVSLLTGQNAARHRTTNWISPQEDNRGQFGPKDWNWRGLTSDSFTLPRMLQNQGYRTMHVGKGHWGPRHSPGSDPLNLGFDLNCGGSAIGHPGSYFAREGYGAGTTHAVPHLEQFRESGEFLTEALTKVACQMISESVAADEPFFLHFAHYAVHSPFHSDPRFAEDYRDTNRPPAAQAFATLVAGVDDSLGQLVAHLRQLGVAEETLLIFVGDNGTDAPLGGPQEIVCAAPLRGKKGSPYEGGIRVPCLLAWAQVNPAQNCQQQFPIAAGAVQTQVASVCDLAPTLVDLAGGTWPASQPCDGHSLARLVTGNPDPNRGADFVVHFPHGEHRGNYFSLLRQDQWKLIYHYQPQSQPRQVRYELFDLSNDPSESRDLSAERPAVVADLVRQLEERLVDWRALLPEDPQGNPVDGGRLLYPVAPTPPPAVVRQ